MLRILIADGTPAAMQAERETFGIPSNASLFEAALRSQQPHIGCSSLNVAAWVDDAQFRPEVRDAYQRLVAQGWTDALRVLHPDERIYTFWKYFRNAFARDA